MPNWMSWCLTALVFGFATSAAADGQTWWTMFYAFLAGGLFMGDVLKARGRIVDTP